VGSLVAWIALGGGRALETVYELREERATDAAATP
jgi:hypothetical protein